MDERHATGAGTRHGGRHCRGKAFGQNFDTYAVEYTYPDGTKLFRCRDISRCDGEFSSYRQDTSGSAGMIEFACTFPQSEEAGLKHHVIELHSEDGPMNGAEDSHRRVKQAKFWCFSLPNKTV